MQFKIAGLCYSRFCRSVCWLLISMLFLGLTLAGCGGGGGTALVPKGAIEGYVYVPEGTRGGNLAVFTRAALSGYQPVPYATVEVVIGMTRKTTTTDSKGYFKLDGLPEGQATVKITPPLGGVFGDLLTVTTTIEVIGNTTAKIGTGGSVSMVSHAADHLNVMVNHIDTSAYPKVRVLVSVVDPVSNSPILGLTANEFTLLQDGQSQALSVSQPGGSTAAPSASVLVLDRSGSMEGSNYDGQPLNDLKSAADRYVTSLGPQDVAAIISFGSDVRRDSNGFSSDVVALRDAIYALTPGGATALFDAIWVAVQDLSGRAETRRAVIAMTDGGENASWQATLDQIVAYAVDRGILIYTVGLQGYDFSTRGTKSSDVPKHSPTRSENDLKQLASGTGAEYFYAPTSPELQSIYEKITQRMENYYVLEFTAGGQVGSRYSRVDVEVSRDGLGGSGYMAYTSPVVSDGFDYPVSISDGEWSLSQDFGETVYKSQPHLGEDWVRSSGSQGQPVFAVSNGRVIFAGASTSAAWGKLVRVYTEVPGETPVVCQYAHVQNITVSHGDYVDRGQKICEIGPKAVGSSGPHLHFEVRSDTTIGDGPGYSWDQTGWLNPTDRGRLSGAGTGYIDNRRPPL